MFVMSCPTGSDAQRSIERRRCVKVEEIRPLDILDKALLIKEKLWQHGKQLDESPFNNQVSH